MLKTGAAKGPKPAVEGQMVMVSRGAAAGPKPKTRPPKPANSIERAAIPARSAAIFALRADSDVDDDVGAAGGSAVAGAADGLHSTHEDKKNTRSNPHLRTPPGGIDKRT